jgi:hypothetical protein
MTDLSFLSITYIAQMLPFAASAKSVNASIVGAEQGSGPE